MGCIKSIKLLKKVDVMWMTKKTITTLESTKKGYKTISKQCIRNDEESQEISTESIVSLRELGYSIAQLEATLLLMLLVGISYEYWCFLHKIVDGDIK